MGRALRIYLGDLTHTGIGVATEAFPLNVGLVASYALKRFGGEIDVTLFKYPADLLQALKQQTPDILGLSNYTWNTRLSYRFLEWAQAMNPDTLTVFGGTNYPFDAENQKRFLKERPALDLHLYYEGEPAFVQVVERALSVSDRRRFFEQPVAGCQFVDRLTGEFKVGPALPRIKDLDSIPSPYATGLLDKFFDGKLTPLMETARGCPFTCNFCNAGNAYFNKVNLFSDHYVRDEWEYVSRRASNVGIGHMTLADNNFGMIPRDRKTAELMVELRDKYGWPRSVTAWTGKNSKQKVIDVTRLLGDTLAINMAVQSMDGTVLKNIARSNIRLEDYRAIAQELNAQGRPQVAEAIVPLPGETWDSHVAGIRELLDSEVSNINVHTLRMLHGTPYKDDAAYIREHGFLRKHRLVPLDFGLYEGEPIFDTEEVAVATRTMTFEEYGASRQLLLLVDLCYNGTIFEPLKKYLRSAALKVSDWVMDLFGHRDRLPPEAAEIFESFTQETTAELWDSHEGLARFYSKQENYAKLLTGEAGGNVLFKHKTRMMTEAAGPWVETVFSLSEQFLRSSCPGFWNEQRAFELRELKRFILCRLLDAFDLGAASAAAEESFAFDLTAWLQDEAGTPLSRYRVSSPVRLRFDFDEDQARIKQDARKRYGADRTGTVKLIQRLGGTQRFLRKASLVS